MDTDTFRTIDTTDYTHTAMVAKKGIRIWKFFCILTLWNSRVLARGVFYAIHRKVHVRRGP